MTKSDIVAIHYFLSKYSGWSNNIPFDRLRTSIKNSQNFGLFHNNKQIGFVKSAAIELQNCIRINAVSPTVIENSPQYFPFFPGEMPVTMKQLEYGFRKSIFGANTGQVIKPY